MIKEENNVATNNQKTFKLIRNEPACGLIAVDFVNNTENLIIEREIFSKWDKNTNNAVVFHNGKIASMTKRGNDKIINYNVLLDIINVEVKKVNDAPKVVIVSFMDGTFERAVLNDSDIFSLEQGISICITKKLLTNTTGNGSAVYNKIINRAMNAKKWNESEAEKLKRETESLKLKCKKTIEKQRKWSKKMKKREDERFINNLAEAIRRANNK